MNECYLIGELPANITLVQSDLTKWMEKVFMSNGFGVKIVSYEEIAASLGLVLHSSGNHGTVLFMAQQLRFSDDQVNINNVVSQLKIHTTQCGLHYLIIFAI